MHSVSFSKTGGPEVLEYKELKLEDPKSGEVLIKHSAIGLNFIDTYHRSGLYPVPLPSGIGLEGAGIIENFLNTFANLFENSFCVIGTGETKLTGPEIFLFSRQNL